MLWKIEKHKGSGTHYVRTRQCSRGLPTPSQKSDDSAASRIIVVDGMWSCVGSTNFDDRSFQLNDEISLGVLDRKIAGGLTAAFANDLRSATERHNNEWRHLSLWHKLIDQLAYLGSSQL
jgi:phosphatidylserine/phosphatidylglycerophosphate/cardiolipin synthase-like enzyme